MTKIDELNKWLLDNFNHKDFEKVMRERNLLQLKESPKPYLSPSDKSRFGKELKL